MKAFLKNNGLILILYLISIATALFFLLQYEKTTIHIFMNGYVGNYFLNLFFYYITYLGDGNMAVFLLLAILIYNVRLGIYATASFLSASLFSILLKRQLYDDVNRPSFVFKYYLHRDLNLVDGVETYIHNSFPSGHSTQAFAIFMCLIFVTKNQYLKFSFFCLAVLTALSRVYLSQHWLVDITAGSIIGTAFSILFYFLFIAKNKLPNLNKPISDLKKS